MEESTQCENMYIKLSKNIVYHHDNRTCVPGTIIQRFFKLQDNENLSNIAELQQSKFWEIYLQGSF